MMPRPRRPANPSCGKASCRARTILNRARTGMSCHSTESTASRTIRAAIAFMW